MPRSAPTTDSDRADHERRLLEAHVVRVQREVRSCAGCGLCCTERYNATRILPLEARRIARHLESQGSARRAAWTKRLRATVERYRLKRERAAAPYTCPFLERDLRCALPLNVKPLSCLTFNPLEPERCDQEPARFERVYRWLRKANRAARLPEERLPIPLAVLEALDGARDRRR